MNEELDLFLTRKLLEVYPNSVVVKHSDVAGEKHPLYYLRIPGKEDMLLGRGFEAVKQSVAILKKHELAKKA